MSAHQPLPSTLSSRLIFFSFFTLSREKNNIMSNDLVFPSALLGSLPPHLLCCHSFHSSQHLPRAFHLWCTAGGFVTLGASVPARKICLSRCKRVSKGCIQFFFSPTGESIFMDVAFTKFKKSTGHNFCWEAKKGSTLAPEPKCESSL